MDTLVKILLSIVILIISSILVLIISIKIEKNTSLLDMPHPLSNLPWLEHTNDIVAARSNVYCICLPERQEHCNRFFEQLQFSVHYTPVSLKKDLSRKLLRDNNIISPGYINYDGYGQVACSLSHLKAMQIFLTTTHPYAIIFEDDNALPENVDFIKTQIDHFIFKNEEWDYINMSPCYSAICSNENESNMIPYDDASGGYCMNAYILNRRAATFFLKSLPLTFLTPVLDNMFASRSHNLRLFNIHPRLFQQLEPGVPYKSELHNNANKIECNYNNWKPMHQLGVLAKLIQIQLYWHKN